MIDIIEMLCALKENSNITYDLKLCGKKIGYIKIMENGIEEVWVSEQYRKKNYGTMLLRHVEWIAKIAGYERMEVEAVKTSVAPFFEKNGYILSKDKYGEYEGYKMLNACM